MMAGSCRGCCKTGRGVCRRQLNYGGGRIESRILCIRCYGEQDRAADRSFHEHRMKVEALDRRCIMSELLDAGANRIDVAQRANTVTLEVTESIRAYNACRDMDMGKRIGIPMRWLDGSAEFPATAEGLRAAIEYCGCYGQAASLRARMAAWRRKVDASKAQAVAA